MLLYYFKSLQQSTSYYSYYTNLPLMSTSQHYGKMHTAPLKIVGASVSVVTSRSRSLSEQV